MGCGVAGVLAVLLCVLAGLLGVLDAVGAVSPCAVTAVGVLARWSGAVGVGRFRGAMRATKRLGGRRAVGRRLEAIHSGRG